MSDAAPCACPGPGFCARRGRAVTRTGHRVCSGGDPASAALYFGDSPGAPPAAPLPSRAEAAAVVECIKAAKKCERRTLIGSCTYARCSAGRGGLNGKVSLADCLECYRTAAPWPPPEVTSPH